MFAWSNLLVFVILVTNICLETTNAEDKLVLYGEYCDNTEFLCDSRFFLECNSTWKCGCEHPEKSHYFKKENWCVLNLHEECHPAPYAQRCGEYAYCARIVDDEGNWRYECQCSEYYAESGNECVYLQGPTYGKGEENTYGSRSVMKCNDDGECTCDPSHPDIWYQKATNSCVLLEGARCGIEGQVPWYYNGDSDHIIFRDLIERVGASKQQYMQCVESAECQYLRGIPTCVCTNGADQTSSRRCVANFGENCGSAFYQEKCREKSFLECRNGRCECADKNSWYDRKSGKCLLLSGDVCTGNENSCIPQAYCSLRTGKCTCLSGLKENQHRRCTLDYGVACMNQPHGWNCDKTKFLVCDSTKGICDCFDSNQTFFEDGMCKLRANAVCDPNSNFSPPCIKNAICSAKADNTSYCICREPLRSTSAGHCVRKRKHNEICDLNNFPSGDCAEEEFLECSPDKKRCECEAPSRFNSKLKMCTTGLGKTCSDCKKSPPCDPTLICISGVCMKNTGHRYVPFDSILCITFQSLFLYYAKFSW